MTESNAPLKVMGRYALYEPIAAGGMATVHFGRLLGPAGFARTVAIKRLHAELALDPEFVSMFVDEARLAGRLRHPNVVPIVDVISGAGELFLVMDYVQGETLSRLLRAVVRRSTRVPVPIACAIACGVLEGLHAAHEAKDERGEDLHIVHRDVSPQNILVGTDGVARVLDFGIAKAMNRLHSTEKGRLKGKYAYMSVEQVRGEVSRRTDVYAVAVCLWETLTATRLFDGEPLDILRRVKEEPIAKPSTIVEGIPPALDEIVMRGLSRDESERFATARDMARAIQREVSVAPPSDVADWVEAIGGTDLGKRAASIARIEGLSAVPADATALLAELHGQPTVVDAKAETIAPNKASRRDRVAIVLAGALLVAVGVAAIALPSRAPAVETAKPAASAPPAPSPSSAPSVIETTVASTSVAPVAVASAVAPKPRPVFKTVSKPDCTPPYVIDAQGKKRFKAECL